MCGRFVRSEQAQPQAYPLGHKQRTSGEKLALTEAVMRLLKTGQIVAPAESPAEAWQRHAAQAAFEDGGEMAGFQQPA